jgi:hypothetical protein
MVNESDRHRVSPMTPESSSLPSLVAMLMTCRPSRSRHLEELLLLLHGRAVPRSGFAGPCIPCPRPSESGVSKPPLITPRRQPNPPPSLAVTTKPLPVPRRAFSSGERKDVRGSFMLGGNSLRSSRVMVRGTGPAGGWRVAGGGTCCRDRNDAIGHRVLSAGEAESQSTRLEQRRPSELSAWADAPATFSPGFQSQKTNHDATELNRP